MTQSASGAEHADAPAAGSASVPVLMNLQELGAINLEPLGDDGAGYCADGVCFPGAAESGQADVSRT